MLNNKKIISKNDIILILGVLIIAFAFFIIMQINKKTGYNVSIMVDGDAVKTLSLDEDCEYSVDTKLGHNLVVIKDNEVFVKDADCRDKICYKHAKISDIGETIICLPHKLVIEVKE